ncbi:hypothetical protein [Prosthecomicrobium hirschii]|uniref:hypothetical protein n=1 Tax=Prosthecodimorpha hirschii TaxID=665126 RepID=UPI00221E5241|nr:hypothetical protein [Prosthecomicrobium hirschii]MCW1838742.1 hypothetical protein [Prosthecomicrobium hirschii]
MPNPTHARTIRDLATHLGIGKTRVGQLLKEGRLPPAGPAGFDIAACKAAYGTAIDPDWSARQKVNSRRGVETRQKKSTPMPQTGDAAKAMAALALGKARIARLKLDVARGDLLDVLAVQSRLSAAVTSAKQRILQLEPTLTPALMSSVTSADLRAILHDALHRLQARFQ